jgi:hypothetical protein
MPETVTKTVLLKNLPPLLKKLVMGAGVRPKAVRVTFTDGVPTVTETWRTSPTVGIGEKVVLPTEYWMGSDGESNSSTDVTFSVAAVSTWTKCGSNSKSGAAIVIGGLTPALKEMLNSPVEEFALGALEVALDAAMERAAPVTAGAAVVEEPYTLVEWLAACA